MKQKIALLLALGITLATPPSTYAALGGPVHHHYRAIHRQTTVVRAEAPPPATIFAPVRPATFGDHETDGLSRNPEDCNTYGCIDNGGD